MAGSHHTKSFEQELRTGFIACSRMAAEAYKTNTCELDLDSGKSIGQDL